MSLDNPVIFVHSRKERTLWGLVSFKGVVLKKKKEYKLRPGVEMFCNQIQEGSLCSVLKLNWKSIT